MAPVGRPLEIAGCMLATLLVIGCASEQEQIHAIAAVNRAYKVSYERLLNESGTRRFAVEKREAFVAMRVVLARYGMQAEHQDLSIGYVGVSGPVPAPLTEAEWRAASSLDLATYRSLLEPHVGYQISNFAEFETKGLDVVLNATFVEVPGGTDVSITMRLREVLIPRAGWPRREYLSPTVLKASLDKVYRGVEQELATSGRAARSPAR